MIFTTKKTIAIILAVMVCLSLIACSSSNKTDKKAALKGTWTISEITIGNDNEPYEDSDLSNIIIELYGDGVGLLTTPFKDLFFPGDGQSTIVYADKVFYMYGKEYAYRYNGKEIAVDYDTEEGTIHLLLNRTSSSTATMHNTGNNKKPSNSIIGVWSATGARLNGRHLTGRELKDQIGSVSITLMENGVGILHYKDGFLNMTETLAYDGETYTVMGKTIPYIYYPNTIETTVYFGFDSGVDLIFTNSKNGSSEAEDYDLPSDPDRPAPTIPASISAGDTITFGLYNGKPIEWTVLLVGKGRALLISRQPVADRPFDAHDNYTDVTWENCTLRYWLNNDFYYDAFSYDEQALIPEVSVLAEKNSVTGANSGRNTFDKVFLLSLSEVQAYMPTERERAFDESSCSSWSWCLRTVGDYTYWVEGNMYQAAPVAITYDGTILYGVQFASDNYAVRPTIWIELDI